MPVRTAEIAGAGFAGLVASIGLAERGWRVRVHERTPFLRAEGFALTIHPNAVRVLEAVGAFADAAAGAMRISRLDTIDAQDNVTLSIVPGADLYRISRDRLISSLAKRAEALGVEIKVGSRIVAGDPDGVLRDEDGKNYRADLVVAADGVGSVIRDGAGFRVRRFSLPSGGGMRVVIPRSGAEKRAEPGDASANREYWSGRRRIIANACTRDDIYLALAAPADDAAGRQVPLDVASWERAFPRRGDLFRRISDHAPWDRVKWAPFQIVRLDRWSKGRLAVLGDAAHAMPPDLGQGGCTAMMNALGLAVAVAAAPGVEGGLRAWEAAERPLTEHTQRWAGLYNRTSMWPEVLRNGAFRLVGRSAYLRGQVQRTANHVPTGTAPR